MVWSEWNERMEVVRAMLRSERRRRRRGMNLIEVVIVIVIILVIVGVLLAGANALRNNALYGTTKVQVQKIGAAVQSHVDLVNDGEPPSSLDEVGDLKASDLKDSYGYDLEYVTPGPDDSPFDLISYGKDGKEGGTGNNKDIHYSDMR